MSVSYTDLSDGKNVSFDPLPEYQFPIWSSAQRYQMLMVFRRECTAEELRSVDMLVVQVRIWYDFLLLEVLEDGHLCSFAALAHSNIPGWLPW